jgi:hypothetical protein
MTLSHRHRSSTKKIFVKYGKNLTVSNGHYTTNFPHKNEWSIKKRKWLNKRKFVDPFEIDASRIPYSQLKKKCRICQSTNIVEMHHVKHVRKDGVHYGGFRKEMALLNRKQIPLCRECHMKVHDRLYNGVKLGTLKKV